MNAPASPVVESHPPTSHRFKENAHRALADASLQKALKHLDYSEYGGAPLLGVRGVSVISHGKSSPRAIKNAIKVAAKSVESRMSEHIGRRLGETNGNAGSVA